jgi:drug/metabolite transporter (DMT)-like permease
MTTLALLFVLLSAIAHATWNLLMKRAKRPEVFSWWLLVSAAALLAPMGAVLLWRDPPSARGWLFIVGTGFLHVLYFVFLGRSYARADLSLAYPIARGTGPALVPVAGVLVLHETVAPMAIVGIACVVLGIFTIYWGGRLGQLLKDPFALVKASGTRYALLTGLVITVYSVWDKEGVRHVNSFLYMYMLTLGTGLCLAPYILKVHGISAVHEEWRINAPRVVLSGLLTFVAYGLVLTALTFSRVSYVAPAREVGIVFGALLGIVVLRESFARSRLVGSSLIVAGLTMIALAP